MKLIIDIPEEAYRDRKMSLYFGCYSGQLHSTLYNGIPLDKIRAEIADIYCGQYCENPYTAASVRKMALDIIDKYRAESEE